jgi:hypothetical protein
VTIRVFQGQPTVLDSFPSSMNGCDGQQFFIRWRSANPT